jgi:hypothetical protein
MSIGSLNIKFDGSYVIWLLICAVGIRVFMSLLRTAILVYPATKDLYRKPKGDVFFRLKGRFLYLWLWEDVFSAIASARVKDYGQNFIVGLFELAVFPVLISHMDFVPIGAWIGLKTVAQWGEWKTDRGTFNRFLIGNALVISAAIWLATKVHITPDATSFCFTPG